MEQDDVLNAANRMWLYAYELDKLLGNTKASDYVAQQVAPMAHLDLEGCRERVESLARSLEVRLEQERGNP